MMASLCSAERAIWRLGCCVLYPEHAMPLEDSDSGACGVCRRASVRRVVRDLQADLQLAGGVVTRRTLGLRARAVPGRFPARARVIATTAIMGLVRTARGRG